MKFHDGKDMRVEDVVWSLNRINDPAKPASNNFLALPKDIWDKAVKIDDTTLRITTKKPTRMVESWRFWFIMPENADTRKPDLGDAAGRHRAVPVQELRQGRPARADEVRRTTGTSGQPYLDNLTFKFLADEAAQVANFLSGDVNYLHDISVATLPQVQGKHNSKLIPSGLFFEWWQPQMYFGPLADVKVRRALQWAFDRKTPTTRSRGRGRGDPTPGTRSRRARTTSARSGRSRYDPEKAKSHARQGRAAEPEAQHDDPLGPGPVASRGRRAPAGLQEGRASTRRSSRCRRLSGSTGSTRSATTRASRSTRAACPFPWALIANYMMKATLLQEPAEVPEAVRSRPLEAAYNQAFSSANEAQYARR